MKNWKTRSWSTPATIGVGLFVTTTGLIMFFIVEQPFKLAHELAGIGFSIAILLHVLSHWRSFSAYFRQRRALTILAAAWLAGAGSVTASAVFEMGEPEALVIAGIEDARVSLLAPIVNMEEEELVARLGADGFPVTDPEMSLRELAEHLGSDTDDLLRSVFR